MVGLFYYVFPIVFNLSLFSMSTYKGVIMLVVLFVAILAITTTIQIFRTGIDDGTDLLILSKPTSRVEMMWSKMIVLIFINLIVSVIATFIVIWTIFSPYNSENISGDIIISTFVGTTVNFLFWSSITITISILFRKFTAFILSIGFQAVLIVISIVSALVIKTPGTTMANDYNIRLNGLAVLSQPNSENQVSYDWGVVPVRGLKNSKVINENSKFNGVTLKSTGTDMSNFIQNMWTYMDKHSNQTTSKVIDLDFQLSMLLSFIRNQTLDNMNANDILGQMFYQGGFPTSYNLTFSRSSKRKLPNDTSIEKINLSNNSFVLSSNSSLEIKNTNGSFRYFSEKILPQNFGIMKTKFDLSDLSFPMWNDDNEFTLHHFDNVADFAKFYYGPNQVDNIKKFFTAYLKNSQSSVNNLYSRSYYDSLLAMYIANKFNVDLSKDNSINKLKDCFLDPLNTLSTEFQYATYYALLDYTKNPQNYTDWMTSTSYELMLSELKVSQKDMPSLDSENWSHYSKVFTGSIEQLKQYLLNDKETENNNLQRWIYLRTNLALVPEINLQTFVTINFVNEYDITTLILCWTFVSLIFMIAGMNIYIRKDIA